MATLTERQRGELIRRYPFRVADEVMRGQRPVPQDIAEIEPTIEQPRRSAAAAARAPTNPGPSTDPGPSIDPRLADWAAGRVQDGTGPSTVSTTPPPSGRRGTGVPGQTTMRDRIMRGAAGMGHIPTPRPQQRGAFPELMERPLVEPEPGPTRREMIGAVLSGTEPSRVVVGGASDLIRSALGILPYAPPFANSPLAEHQIRRLQEAIPQVAEPETPTGQLVREAIPPVVSGVAGAGVGGLVGAGGGLARGLAGLGTSVALPAVIDAALIPPEDPNVSSVLRSEFGLTDPITGALATNPDDPDVVNRLRNAAEAGIVGGAIDLGVRGARFLSPRMRGLSRTSRMNALDERFDRMLQRVRESRRSEELSSYLNDVIEIRNIARGIRDPDLYERAIERAEAALDAPLDLAGAPLRNQPVPPTRVPDPANPADEIARLADETARGVPPQRPQAPYSGPAAETRVNDPRTTDIPNPEEPAPRLEPPRARVPDADGGPPRNINLQHIDVPEDVQSIIMRISEESGNFRQARRGVLHDEQLYRLARDIGLTPARLIAKGPRWLMQAPENIFAARRVMASAAEDVARLARQRIAERVAGGVTDATNRAYDDAIMQLRHVEQYISGATSDIARSLRQFRLAASADRSDAIRRVLPGMERMSPEEFDRTIVSAAELGGEGAISRAITNAQRGVFRRATDGVYLYWLQSILSGPRTQVANIIGNTTNIIQDMMRYPAAATIGAARRAGAAVLGRELPNTITYREVGDRFAGLAAGIPGGLRRFFRGLLGFEDEMFSSVTKLEDVVSSSVNMSWPKRIGGLILPTRWLTGADNFFKSLAYESELYGQAVRRARAAGLTGDALTRRIGEIIAAPTDDVIDAAIGAANRLTFTEGLGEYGRKFAQLRHVPGVRWVMPFVRTPTNIIRTAARHVPALTQESRRALAAGGAAREAELGRIAVSSAIGVAMWNGWANGNITGYGPTDRQERAQWLREGNQPYSIRIGDTWYSYARIEPFVTIFGTMLDLFDLGDRVIDGDLKENESILSALAMVLSNTLVNRTWMSSLNDAIQAISEPERYGEYWLVRMAAGFIPNFLAQIAQDQDEIMRDSRGIGAIDSIRRALMARLPSSPADDILRHIGLGPRQDLPARLDFYGREIPRESFGPESISPIYTTDATPENNLDEELRRIGITPGRHTRRVSGVELTPEQYETYTRSVGQEIERRLGQLFRSPEYASLSRAQQAEAANDIIREARDNARNSLVSADPELARIIRDEDIQSYVDQGATRDVAELLIDTPYSPSDYYLYHGSRSNAASPEMDDAQFARRQAVFWNEYNTAVSAELDRLRTMAPDARRNRLSDLARQARLRADDIIRQEAMYRRTGGSALANKLPDQGPVVETPPSAPVPGRRPASGEVRVPIEPAQEPQERVPDPAPSESTPRPRRSPRATPARSRAPATSSRVSQELSSIGRRLGNPNLPMTQEFGNVASLGAFGGSSQPTAPAIQRVSSRPINVARAGQMPNTLTPRGGAPSGGGGFMNWLASDQGRGVSRMLMDFGTTLMQNAGPSTTPVNPWGNALAALSESMGRVADERRDRQERTQEAQRLTEYYASLGEQAAQLPLDPQIMGVARTMLSNPETSDRGLSILTDQIRQLGTARARGYEPYNRGAPQYRNREGQDVSDIVAQAREMVRRDPDMLQDMRYRLWSEYGIDPDLLSE